MRRREKENAVVSLLPLAAVLALSLSGCNMGSGSEDIVMQEGGSSKTCKMDVAAGVETVAGETDLRVKASMECTKLSSTDKKRLTGCRVRGAKDVTCPNGWHVDEAAVQAFEPVTCSLADTGQVRKLCAKTTARIFLETAVSSPERTLAASYARAGLLQRKNR